MMSSLKSTHTPSVIALCISILLLIAGCASTPVYQVDLMPAPDVYGDGLLNPLPENDPLSYSVPYKGILYATDRKPATENDPERYYLNDRGKVVRLGVAKVTLVIKILSGVIAAKYRC